MKKQLWAMVLAILLVCQLALPVAEAGDTVYFTAAGESVLPLSDSTMPFWHGGYLYIPSTMFTDNVWRSLGISYIINNQGVVILHNASQAAGRSLLFEPGKDYTKDSDGNRHQPGSVKRGGVTFVPAFLVASFFGLQYSVTEVPHGYLVWLRKPDFGLTDKAFADAANYNMEMQYEAYQKAKNKDDRPEPTPGNPTVPDAPGGHGGGVYLSLEAGAETSMMLDVLRAGRGYAAFFCRPDFLETQGDLLRRMTAEGHSIGLLVDGSSGVPLDQQLDRGNDALERAACTRTRLIYVENGSEEDLQLARDLGYVPLEPELDRTDYKLKSASNANSLMKRIASRKGSVTVWAGDTANAFGLRHFLAAVDRAEDHCLALQEIAAGA